MHGLHSFSYRSDKSDDMLSRTSLLSCESLPVADLGLSQYTVPDQTEPMLKTVESMPRLLPITPDLRDSLHRDSLMPETNFEHWVAMNKKPFNVRVLNLACFPVAQSLYRTNYRSLASVRAKMGSIQNPAKSLDLVRTLLQRSINREIGLIVNKYAQEFFEPALVNIRENSGENFVSDEHLQTVCRQILEEAKKMFSSDSRCATPFDTSDNASDTASMSDARPSRHAKSVFMPRKRLLSSGSESSSKTFKQKKKHRSFAQVQSGSGRSTPSRPAKSEPVKREGPLWNTDRLKADTLFVMGSKANKALGLGATRGRLYIKHPEIFKYAGDQDDKQWLHEKHYMPATGGRTYLLLVEDILELAKTDEYRNSSGLLLDELKGFTVPEWMLDKMKFQMRSLRTDGEHSFKLVYELTNTVSSQETSPANTNVNDLSPDNSGYDAAISPLNETGGFSRELSPAASPDYCDENSDAYCENSTLSGTFLTDDLKPSF